VTRYARQETGVFAMPVIPTASPRRVLATRQKGWARGLAHQLAAIGVRPNDVSVASVCVALIAAAAFLWSPLLTVSGRAALLVVAAASIQLRLLCNMLDGMLAVEEGLKSVTGDVFNDLPDRIADVVILASAGYAVPEIPLATTLGWAAATLAVLTAYIRVFAGSLGLTQHFIGPMAKQHRMFTLTVATLLGAVEAITSAPSRAIPIGLAVIVVGSVVTGVRRSSRLMHEARTR
jgi:phosphatidylglycerophosphate synthase